jgi:hypothetical protein
MFVTIARERKHSAHGWVGLTTTDCLRRLGIFHLPKLKIITFGNLSVKPPQRSDLNQLASLILGAIQAREKTRQLTATQPHRDLKNAEKDKKRQVIEMLSSTPKTSLIGVISRSDFEVPLRAIGGMVFDRVFEQIRKDEVSPDDKSKIRSLAIAHGGHWKKLESLLFRASKKQP